MKYYLIEIWGDVEPDIISEHSTDKERLEAARTHREEHGDKCGLYRLDITEKGIPSIIAFGSSEIDLDYESEWE